MRGHSAAPGTRRARRHVAVTAVAALLALTTGAPVAIAERAQAPRIERLAGDGRVATAVAVSRASFARADAAVLARADAFADALAGGPLAAALDGPLLLVDRAGVDDAVTAELARLGVDQVVLLGGAAAIASAVEQSLRSDYAVSRLAGATRYETATAVAAALPASDHAVVATGEAFADALALAPWAAHVGAPILLTAADRLPPASARALATRAPEEVVVAGGPAAVGPAVETALAADGRDVRRVAGRTRLETAAAAFDHAVTGGLDPSTLWLATADAFPDALAAGPAVAAGGDALLLVDGQDLRGPSVVTARLRAHDVGRVRLLGGRGAISSGASGQLRDVLGGGQLPGGGWRLFPDRRVVGYYGHPSSGLLGVLGESGPQDAAQRLLAVTAAYQQSDRPVLPAFELVTTLAQRDPGPDGNYSSPLDHQTVQAYLEAVRGVDGILILDLQPGRTDFLTDLRRYERFLSEPDVGVGLDPEWRVGPGQVPGRDAGSVDADEINEVSAYLADVVARHDLPEKLLLVHRFTDAMVTGAERITERDGVAIAFDMDGQGDRAAKERAYRRYADRRFAAGLMLFYRRDRDLLSAADAMALTPSPDLVIHQ